MNALTIVHAFLIGNTLHYFMLSSRLSAITHRARLSLTSPSIPLTARVWARLPLVVRPDRPPLTSFPEYAGKWSTGHYSHPASGAGKGFAIPSPADALHQSDRLMPLLPSPAERAAVTEVTALHRASPPPGQTRRVLRKPLNYLLNNIPFMRYPHVSE